ncbi:hypothetical protein [Enterococcus cecorum]|uniref:Uncharacterized protein n=1 Tax=Enterococcus cecorum TaxID=44008 RepID=A0A366SKC4_9ENTE|nr:hypothetical protein [Enterococcus cecorum]RBR31785.1 hypothetical protein EB18_00208 [Enterococcus cecorum]
MESELQKLLEQLNQLNQQENLEQKLALFEQVNERFTSITAQKTAKLDQALMLKIIEAYQQFIQTAQESKTSLSKEIARLNQENQALKKYVPLEELSGIELYY